MMWASFQFDFLFAKSEPVTVNAGQIKVNVTLPKFQHKSFSAFSRHPSLAKWGAAKAAVMHLKNQRNVFIQATHNELVKNYENIIREKQLNDDDGHGNSHRI